MESLDRFKEWQKEKPGRSVTINLGECGDPNFVQIWAYDYGLGVGQMVETVEEINLEEEKKKEELELLHRLQKKYNDHIGGM